MNTSNRLKVSLLSCLLLAGATGAPIPEACAGWQKDMVCQGSCGGGCGPCPDSGSSSSSFQTSAPQMAWGGMTKRAAGMVEECGPKPLCILVRGATLFPLGLAMDAPVYLAKGLVLGGYYGAKGLSAAARGTGRAIAYPFNRPAKPIPPADDWETYKRHVLAYQKAVTKKNPANKENQLWCKTHLPLAMGANRTNWEARCNPSGSVEHTAAVTAPSPADAADERRTKVLGCAIAEAARDAAAAGPEGQALAAEVKADIRQVLAELKARPPSGRDGDTKVFTTGKDYVVKGPAGEGQTVVRVTVVRDEKSGDLSVDVMSSVGGDGRPEAASQNIIALDPEGNVKSKETSAAAEACLKDAG